MGGAGGGPHLHVGFLERIDIHREQATGEARYGFLHFALAADGKRCMDQMDGFNLAGLVATCA